MIQIDKIGEGGYRYHFPTIDFKFQNTGHATAFVWQFAIKVIHAEIDPKPELEFWAKVTDDALEVEVVNNGWGTAHDCHILVDESTLNQLFSKSVRQFRGTLQSGERKQVLRLTRNMADASQFEAISKAFVPVNVREDRYNYPQQKEPIYGIELRWINAKWTCADDKGKRYEGENPVWVAGGHITLWRRIALTPSGFVSYWESPGIHYCLEPSYVTYITIIDTSKNSHERTYPISRKIPSGDVERFHIMIGSPTSCNLRIQFKFFVDSGSVIESEEFDINIWNPMNSGWHQNYADGTELSRDVDEPLGFPKPEEIEEGEWEIFREIFRRGRRIRRIDPDYPFTKPKDY